jgi:uncharacterized protein
MSLRDMPAVRAIRSALGAIGNAEAVAVSATAARTSSEFVAGAVSGLGQSEASRRYLTASEICRIVAAEIAEREAAGAQLDALGHGAEAQRLRREALVLSRILDAPGT